MPRPDNAEVPKVEGGHFGDPETLGQSNDRGVSAAQGQIAILLHKGGRSGEVGCGEVGDGQKAGGEGTEERRLLVDPAVPGDQVANLSDH